MTSTRRWHSYDNAHAHPDESILLAYLRGQQLEARASVLQHIEQSKCSVCLQKLSELKQVSSTLDILAEMRAYQSYPEVSTAAIYARIQQAGLHHIPTHPALRVTFGRQHPRKSAIRLMSVPVAFGLAILFTVAMLVYANFPGRTFTLFSSDGGTRSRPNMWTVAVPAHSTSTPAVNVKAVATGTPGAKEPHMKVCSTRLEISQMRLVICGSHFDSKYKANLVVDVPGKRHFRLNAIPVDRHGKFRVGWLIADCSNVPTLIQGYEITKSKRIKVELQITSFGSCHA